MNHRKFFWTLLISGFAGSGGSSCANKVDSRGDETHFQTCAIDADCQDLGANYRCDAKRCVAAGAEACEDETEPPYIDYRRCDGLAAGGALSSNGSCSWLAAPSIDHPADPTPLSSLSCGPDAGPDTAPALSGFCKHIFELGDPFGGAISDACVGGMTLGTFQVEQPPGAGGLGGRSVTFKSVAGVWVSLDVTKLCDPGQPAALRACTKTILPCPRPPICTPGGQWGCEDIVATCPALSMEECRQGFDSRDHAGRVRIHECLGNAPGDCKEAFYQCAWGL